MDTTTIPTRTLAALDGHAQHGRPCGHFVTAVLENDLNAAVCRADDENLAALLPIVKYVYNELPSSCWGSRAKVEAWRASKSAPVTP